MIPFHGVDQVVAVLSRGTVLRGSSSIIKAETSELGVSSLRWYVHEGKEALIIAITN